MQRIDEVTAEVMEQVVKNKDNFVWKIITSTGMLYEMSIEAMTEFLIDYNAGKEEGRYLAEALPNLSFEDEQFDLALSSHFLFLYSEHLDEDFHMKSILEMLRVAKEVRVFTLGATSGLVGSFITALTVMSFIPYSYITYKAGDFGVYINVILISMALADV